MPYVSVLKSKSVPMPYTSALTAYVRFMQWFRQQHPELYDRYWQNITAPATGGEVHIDASGLDPKVFVQLMQLQFEYYHPV